MSTKEMITGFLFITLAIGLIIFLSYKEYQEETIYLKTNNCHNTGEKIEGDVLTGIGVSGSGNAVVTTSSTPDKYKWSCETGEVLWLNRSEL